MLPFEWNRCAFRGGCLSLYPASGRTPGPCVPPLGDGVRASGRRDPREPLQPPSPEGLWGRLKYDESKLGSDSPDVRTRLSLEGPDSGPEGGVATGGSGRASSSDGLLTGGTIRPETRGPSTPPGRRRRSDLDRRADADCPILRRYLLLLVLRARGRTPTLFYTVLTFGRRPATRARTTTTPAASEGSQRPGQSPARLASGRSPFVQAPPPQPPTALRARPPRVRRGSPDPQGPLSLSRDPEDLGPGGFSNA